MVLIGQSRASPAVTTTPARPTPLASSQQLADCSTGRLQNEWRLRLSDAYPHINRPTLLLPSHSLFPPSPICSSSFPSFRAFHPTLPRVPQAGSRRPAQTPPRKRGGGHHTQDRAGTRRLPPQRPVRALPRPGPHALRPHCAADWAQVGRG